jgi:transposase
LTVDAHGVPLRVIITDGPTADCTQAAALIDGMSAGHLLADKGYDTDAMVAQAIVQKISPVMPPKRNRIVPREYDRHLYNSRHLVENAFLGLKGWRGVATRYEKKASSFLAIVQIRCVRLWATIL